MRAVLIGFPFDEKKSREQSADEQESLKVEMALDFPHKTEDRHDCIVLCFPDIVKSIHPTIDLEKDRFDLKKETMPVLQVIEDRNVKSVRM